MSPAEKVLAHRIKTLRKLKGLSQEELAHGTGLSRSALAKIETAQRTVSALELNAISLALELSLDELLSIGSFDEYESVQKGNAAKTISPTPGKLKTVLLYILERCAGKPNVGVTVLYKLLYFVDFNYYEACRKCLTGMRYRKLPYGPVPILIDQFLNELVEVKDLERIKCRYQGYIQTRYIPLRCADPSQVQPDEKAVIDKVIAECADMSAAEISARSHADIPWIITMNGQEIDYESTFLRTSYSME